MLCKIKHIKSRHCQGRELYLVPMLQNKWLLQIPLVPIDGKLCLVFLFFILHCGLKQPIETLSTMKYGGIFISANESNAKIFMDGTDTQKATPDTLLQIIAGLHTIQVTKPGYICTPPEIAVLVKKDSMASIFFNLQPVVQTGRLIVYSKPEKAAIVIDGQFSGGWTPDTLLLSVGSHELSLVKNGFKPFLQSIIINADSIASISALMQIRNCVLLESFANVSCVPCVAAGNALADFIAANDPDDYIIVEYFTNWPNPNDPFYLAAPNAISGRVSFYNVSLLPCLILDGANRVTATSLPEIQNAFQNLIVQRPLIALSLERRLNQDEAIVELNVIKEPDAPDRPNDRVFVGVVENNISFQSPPGINGLTHFNSVFRKFLTPDAGLAMDQQYTDIPLSFNFKWPAGWEYQNCVIFAFLQNVETKQIMQTVFK